MQANQTADMIKVAAKPPPKRKAKSERPCFQVLQVQGADDLVAEWRAKLDWGNLEKVKKWNVQVNTQMMAVQGRVLPPPAIHYASGQQRPDRG